MFGDFRSSKISEIEERILKYWQEKKIFEKSVNRKAPKGDYVFYDGPPFATGLPHYGHILASTIKDLIPRYKTMQGYFVRRRWGWDCHGLPIEEIVERKLGISGKKQIEKIGIKKFNEACRGMVLQFADEWGKTIRRIARWVDFDNSYKTMDADYMESVWWAFKKIYDKGLVYEGRKVLMYCPRCETPVSNFEVAMDNSYQDVTEEAVIAKFHLKPGQKFGKSYITRETAYILSWTTTPWTLPGNVALAVGGDINYTALRIMGVKELYIVASNLVPRVFKNKNIEIVHNDIKGKNLIGLQYESLFNVPAVKSDKTFRVYPGDFISTEEGTGVVHTAVVYGEEDYKLGQKFNLPVIPLLDDKGKFNDRAPKFLRGIYFKDADKIIISDLEKRGLLFQKELHSHSYPHCWRCGTPLFYNAIPAWFINIQNIKKGLIKSNAREISWYPAHLKHGRYEKSVEQAPDWNISRNRYWGNPIPIWKCDSCGKNQVIGSLEELKNYSSKSGNQYFLMRHGEALSNTKKINSATLKTAQKYPLTMRGKTEVAETAKKLKGKKIELIFSSDFRRTKETANIVAAELKLSSKNIIFDKRLREYNVGIFDGQNIEKYRQFAPTREERFWKKPKKGETVVELKNRLMDFLYEIDRKYKNKNILIVSHEYPIWLIVAGAIGADKKKTLVLKENKPDFLKTGEFLKLDFTPLPHNDNFELDLHRPYIDVFEIRCRHCKGETRRAKEIFDSWTEAGCMPFAEYHYPFENKRAFESRLPAQFVAEYIAQTRAWFYVMHVVSYIIFGKAPFENVVTTGTILAEDGSKMSKSKGNFPDPWDVIQQYGVDALRFYLMNSVVMQADNLNFNVRDLQTIYRRVVIILQNVYNYFDIYAKSEIKSAKTGRKTILDRWILSRTEEMIAGTSRSLDNYDTVRATRLITEYIDDLSTWYLRRSRGRKDKAFFATLGEALLKTSKIIAPIMPYLAEILYTGLSKISKDRKYQESVHLEKWPRFNSRLIDEKLTENMVDVRRFASLGLEARAKSGIRVRQPLASLKIKNPRLRQGFGGQEKSKIKNNKELLKILADEVNVKEIIFDKNIKNEVELDAKITPELKQEGILREFVRLVQNLRQKANYAPKDKIHLWLEVPELFGSALAHHFKQFKERVGAKNIEFRRTEKFSAEIETQIDSQKVWAGIRKV
jgi:isoleucyl-tRNA synthetase